MRSRSISYSRPAGREVSRAAGADVNGAHTPTNPTSRYPFRPGRSTGSFRRGCRYRPGQPDRATGDELGRGLGDQLDRGPDWRDVEPLALLIAARMSATASRRI